MASLRRECMPRNVTDRARLDYEHVACLLARSRSHTRRLAVRVLCSKGQSVFESLFPWPFFFVVTKVLQQVSRG